MSLSFKPLEFNPNMAADGKVLFPEHSAVVIAGNDIDGPFKIQIQVDKDSRGVIQGANVRFLDLTTDNKDYRPVENEKASVKVIGKTSLKNGAFHDPDAGNGIVMDAFQKDPEYRRGKTHAGRLNTCHKYIERIFENQQLKKGTSFCFTFSLLCNFHK